MNTTLKRAVLFLVTVMFNISAYALDVKSGPKDDPENPIRIFAIFHDDVPPERRRATYVEHIRPFTVEFEKITGRKIYVIFDRDRKPYTNFNYKSDDHEQMFEGWKKLVWQYKKERHDSKEFLASKNDRILLITNDFINGGPLFGGVAGMANQPGPAAMATLDLKQAIGHELGHTFNGDHEDGEINYNGWWCETFMFPSALQFRSNCYVFSEGSKNRIKAYVDTL